VGLYGLQTLGRRNAAGVQEKESFLEERCWKKQFLSVGEGVQADLLEFPGRRTQDAESFSVGGEFPDALGGPPCVGKVPCLFPGKDFLS
jgi:hypothetical protein